MKRMDFETNTNEKYNPKNIEEDVEETKTKNKSSKEDDFDSEESETTQEYKVVDPKKKLLLYTIAFLGLVLFVIMLIVNVNQTKTQRSVELDEGGRVVEEVSVEENVSDDSLTTTSYVAPIFSHVGKWKLSEQEVYLELSKNGEFVYSSKVDSETHMAKGHYSVLYGNSALSAAGVKGEELSSIFHVSKEDLVYNNIMYIDCVPEYESYGDEKWVNVSNGEETYEMFSHLVYLFADTEDAVQGEYYDEIYEKTYPMVMQ